MGESSDDSGTAGAAGSNRYWTWFLLVVVLTTLVVGLWIRADRARTIADWKFRLDSIADDRHRMLELWIGERFGDGRLWSQFPSVRELAASHANAAPGAEALEAGHLRAVLAGVVVSYGYAGIRLVDPTGTTILATADAEPFLASCREVFDLALAERRPRMGLHLHDNLPRLAIATPFEDAAGRPLGVLFAELDPKISLYPLLTHEPVPTASGETFLFDSTPQGTILLSPRRRVGATAVLHLLPPDSLRPQSGRTLAQEGFGVFLDERGARVLAATRRIASTGWLLVVLVGESEALGAHRQLTVTAGLAVAAVLATLLVAFAYIRRAARARAEALERLATERHRAAEERTATRLAVERAGELRLLEKIASGAPLDTTLAALVAFIEEQQPGVLASVLRVENGHLWHVVGPSLPEAFRRAIDGLEIGENRGSCGTAAFRGATVVAADISTDPLWSGFADLARQHDLAACWSTPIRTANGSIGGTVALYRREIGGPTDRDLDLIERATHIAAIAIDRTRVEADLENSLAEQRAIFDGTTIGMTIVDPSGRPVKVNPALERFLGYSAAEAGEHHFTDFSVPEERAEGMVLYNQLLSGERDSYQTEKRYVRKDGQIVWGRLTVSLVRSADRSARFAIGMVEDVTERRRLQAEMQQAVKMEAVGQLAGGIAHDFNNILNVILGCGELALAEVEGEPEPRHLLEEILAAADRAALLTRQLLAFSRRQTLAMRDLDLGLVVGEMAQLLRRVLGEDIDIAVSCPPGVAFVRADRGQLEQVLMNLTVNSRDAMPRGGRLAIATLPVTLDAAFVARHPGAHAGPHVLLSVADTGTGMSKEVLARVFEPFFSTKEANKGTGLGLSTVYGIVKQSRGYVAVESQPGTGTRFDIYLPQVAEPPAAAPAAVVEPRRGSETILVVEDEPSLRRLIKTMLTSLGYVVHLAPTAPAAVDLCAPGPEGLAIDLLLTDIVMPEMNGREVARRVRALRPSVRVLYMTGYAGDVLLQRGELEDGGVMLAKPFTRDALALKVREALG